jgi:hypothetical protein
VPPNITISLLQIFKRLDIFSEFVRTRLLLIGAFSAGTKDLITMGITLKIK